MQQGPGYLRLDFLIIAANASLKKKDQLGCIQLLRLCAEGYELSSDCTKMGTIPVLIETLSKLCGIPACHTIVAGVLQPGTCRSGVCVKRRENKE